MLANLSTQEQQVIFECLKAAAKGPFFPDWEFHLLFGIERLTLSDILAKWPDVDESSEDTVLAINNAMGNLIGYPQGEIDQWSKYISVSPEEVLRILKKWKSTL